VDEATLGAEVSPESGAENKRQSKNTGIKGKVKKAHVKTTKDRKKDGASSGDGGYIYKI
jgi:hypothetical protein